MVKISWKTLLKWDDLGGPPLFLETPNCYDHNTIGIRIMVTFFQTQFMPSRATISGQCCRTTSGTGAAAVVLLFDVESDSTGMSNCQFFPTDEHISSVGKLFHSHFKNIPLNSWSCVHLQKTSGQVPRSVDRLQGAVRWLVGWLVGFSWDFFRLTQRILRTAQQKLKNKHLWAPKSVEIKNKKHLFLVDHVGEIRTQQGLVVGDFSFPS